MSTTIKINITSSTTNHTQGHNLDHEVMPVRKYLKTQVDNFVHQDIKLLHIGPPGPGLSYYKQMKFFLTLSIHVKLENINIYTVKYM